MLVKQKNTYLIYTRGLMTEDLTLGSLHLDPANPTDHVRKSFRLETPYVSPPSYAHPLSHKPFHKGPLTQFKLRISACLHRTILSRSLFIRLLNTSWTGRPQVDVPYSLKTRVGSEWLLGAGILGLVKASIGPKDLVEVEVSGESGIRFEIRE
jgi:hypothetical protein